MDVIDRKIIGELEKDGRISTTLLASRVSLSVSATSERLRRLRQSGLITRFSIVVDHKLAGRTLEAIVDVRMPPTVDTAATDIAIAALEPVINAVHVTGRYGLQLRVVARDVAELDQLLTTLHEEVGSEETNTTLVLRTVDGFPRSVKLS